MGRTHFDFWRAITFWIFADMTGVCTVSTVCEVVENSWSCVLGSRVNMLACSSNIKHSKLAGRLASSCVQRRSNSR